MNPPAVLRERSGSLAAAENQFESRDYAQTHLHILLSHFSVLDFTFSAGWAATTSAHMAWPWLGHGQHRHLKHMRYCSRWSGVRAPPSTWESSVLPESQLPAGIVGEEVWTWPDSLKDQDRPCMFCACISAWAVRWRGWALVSHICLPGLSYLLLDIAMSLGPVTECFNV